MKKTSVCGSLFLALMIWASVAPATPVLFPLKSFFFGANYTRAIKITAVHQWLTDGTNLYAGSFINLTPTGGTNPIVNLQPNDYLINAADVPAPLRFSIFPSDGTNLVNVLARITNGLASWPGVSFGFNLTGFTGKVTNLAAVPGQLTGSSTNFVVVTNSAFAGAYIYLGAGPGTTYVCPTNSNYFQYVPAFSHVPSFYILTGSAGSTVQVGVTSPLGTYQDGSVCIQGSGTFTWPDPNYHYNLTTFTNGVCSTNIFQ